MLFWKPNTHPDFDPYFNPYIRKWCVSIQYLKVFYFNTYKQAVDSLPQLRKYRLNVLADVESKNKKFYEARKKAERLQAEALKNAREESKDTSVDYKDLVTHDREKVRKMILDGVDDSEIIIKFNLNNISLAALKHHMKK